MSLLKGLSFCPGENLDIFDSIEDLNLFASKVLLKVLQDRYQVDKPNYSEIFRGYTIADFRALKDLILLMQEN